MVELEKLLNDYDFICVGAITTFNTTPRRAKNPAPYSAPKFNLFPEFKDDRRAWVYLWVLKSRSGLEQVCYVGMAGGTLKKRFQEHTNGARPYPSGSVTGRNNVKKMDVFIGESSGNSISIYARKSKWGKVLGEKICLNSVEELAVIDKCKRYFELWNK